MGTAYVNGRITPNPNLFPPLQGMLQRGSESVDLAYARRLVTIEGRGQSAGRTPKDSRSRASRRISSCSIKTCSRFRSTTSARRTSFGPSSKVELSTVPTKARKVASDSRTTRNEVRDGYRRTPWPDRATVDDVAGASADNQDDQCVAEADALGVDQRIEFGARGPGLVDLTGLAQSADLLGTGQSR